MKLVEALTRPDAWVAIRWGQKWRVGAVVDSAGTVRWHRGRPPKYSMHGRVITFSRQEHAEARAITLNQRDAAASP